MVAVDTNILVRLLTADHPSQFKKARQIFKRLDVFIPHTVVLETERVLRYAYEYDATAISDAFRRLFGLENVEVQSPRSIATAIKWYRDGLDFGDALHLALSQHCDELYSFDARFIGDAKGCSVCRVRRP